MCCRFWIVLLVLLVLPSPVRGQTPDSIEVTLFEGGEGLDFYQQTAEEFQSVSGVPVRLVGDPAMADRMRMRLRARRARAGGARMACAAR